MHAQVFINFDNLYEEMKAYENKFDNYGDYLVDPGSKSISRQSKSNIIDGLLKANKLFFWFGEISSF